MCESIKVLLIEDNAGLARLTQKRLEREGYQVDIATDGEEGVKMYNEGRYDVMLVDQSMPVYDGLEVMRIIDSEESLPPTIMITGTGDEKTAVEAMKLGALDYIVKDVEGGYLELIPSVIESVLRQERLAKEKQQALEKLRKSEVRYRSLFEGVPIGLYRTKPDGKFIEVNSVLIKILGYPDKETLLNSNVDDRYVGVKGHKQWHNLMKQQGIVNELEIQWRRQDGSVIWVRENTRAVRDEKGKILYYDGAVEDITKQRKMEQELRKSHKLESVGVLAGGIAHDFNNLLTSILGNINLAKMYSSEEKVVDRLEESEKASLHARDLVQKLLTFSRGGKPVIKTTFIAELLKDSVEFVLSGSNVRCEFSIPDNLWLVDVDKGQIRQVINNLVMNADEAMPEGGTIYVQAENVNVESENNLPLEAGKYVRISVGDKGKGISKENLPKIFDPYFTTQEMGNKKGTGLGLAICHSIIHDHGGYINIDSELDFGTTVYFYLPASQIKEEVREQILTKGGKVLLMDDEEMVRKIAKEILKHLGYDVELAKNGTEAIKLYEKAKKSEEPFDVVILDLAVQGGMEGKETIEKLLHIDPNVKAVVSSGYSNAPIMSDYRQYGFCDAIAKPYKMEELDEVLSKVKSEA